jgi:hypothetical protein
MMSKKIVFILVVSLIGALSSLYVGLRDDKKYNAGRKAYVCKSNSLNTLYRGGCVLSDLKDSLSFIKFLSGATDIISYAGIGVPIGIEVRLIDSVKVRFEGKEYLLYNAWWRLAEPNQIYGEDEIFWLEASYCSQQPCGKPKYRWKRKR